MADGFTIGAALQTPTIFSCPNCNETIDSSAEACRFCGAKIDREAAQAAAQVLGKVNQACSDASYLKSCTLAIPVFFALRFIPFISMLGSLGFVVVSFAIPVWALVWRSRYGKLVTSDAEFAKARTTVTVCGLIVLAVLVFLVILPFMFGLVLGVMSATRH